MADHPDNDRVSTGVEGLNIILGGGLPRNRMYLLILAQYGIVGGHMPVPVI